MAKFALKDIKRAVEYIEKAKTNENITVYFTPLNALVLGYYDDLSGDKVEITVFEADSNSFPKLSKTERL